MDHMENIINREAAGRFDSLQTKEFNVNIFMQIRIK